MYILDKYQKYAHVYSYNTTHSAQLAPVSLKRAVSARSITAHNGTLYITGEKIEGVLVYDTVSGEESVVYSKLGSIR